MTLSDLLEKTKGFTLEEIKEREAARRRRPVFLISQFASELISLAQEQAAKLEAIAAEPDWHAFYTEVETKRYGLAEKVEEQAAEIERFKGKLDKLQKAVEQEAL